MLQTKGTRQQKHQRNISYQSLPSTLNGLPFSKIQYESILEVDIYEKIENKNTNTEEYDKGVQCHPLYTENIKIHYVL